MVSSSSSTTFLFNHLPLPSSSRAASLHHHHHNPNSLSFPITTKTQNPPTTLSSAPKTSPLKVLSSLQPKETKPDPVYTNRVVAMFVNRIMKGGKKSLAYFIIYQSLKRIQERTETNPLLVLRQAVMKVTPDVAVKPRRVGGSTVQVPVEVGSIQGKAIAIRWLLEASEKRPGKSMTVKLSSEVIDASNGTGEAVRKKENTYKMAEANRAFAHFG